MVGGMWNVGGALLMLLKCGKVKKRESVLQWHNMKTVIDIRQLDNEH